MIGSTPRVVYPTAYKSGTSRPVAGFPIGTRVLPLGVERFEQVGVSPLDDLPLDLESGSQLPCLRGEIMIKDDELLDLRDLGIPRIRLFHGGLNERAHRGIRREFAEIGGEPRLATDERQVVGIDAVQGDDPRRTPSRRRHQLAGSELRWVSAMIVASKSVPGELG